MTIDLDFAGHNTLYATHGLHAYAAKCPPQLANFAIQHYSQIGEIVLDPMLGSGTTLVEARLEGRGGVGFDIDPLACLISRVKTRVIPDDQIDSVYVMLIEHIEKDLASIYSEHPDPDILKKLVIPDFQNRDYWFSKDVQISLAILAFHITNIPMSDEVREFFWVAFSSLILNKTSVANARDIIHSRHHHFEHQEKPDVLNKFVQKIKKMRRQMAEYRSLSLQVPEYMIDIRPGDARELPIKNESIDLIFTSPPYATALDYPRAHFLAVSWMQQPLGISFNEYKTREIAYIGSERGPKPRHFDLDLSLDRFPLAKQVLEQLARIDNPRANLIQRYFLDIQRTFGEIERVLKSNRYIVIVICPSHIRKVEIPTQDVFNEIMASYNIRLIEEFTRTLDGRKRILPYMKDAFGERMLTEYVSVYHKE
jgi:tRNA G10  N-methylase Trm11